MNARLIRNWALALGCGGLIWFVSSLPLRGPVFETAAKNRLDWAAHAVEYGLFATLLFEALRRTFIGRGRVKRALIAAALLASVFAIADEIHQAGVPHRQSDVTDAWADMTGIGLALVMRMRRLSTKHA